MTKPQPIPVENFSHVCVGVSDMGTAVSFSIPVCSGWTSSSTSNSKGAAWKASPTAARTAAEWSVVSSGPCDLGRAGLPEEIASITTLIWCRNAMATSPAQP